ncbi:MAG: hypothetical protein KGY50_03195 [Candidatus Thermoplasmatota archaeon]|nr:hypothetical protein [Candidatus Thermoplasmatota archaeon]
MDNIHQTHANEFEADATQDYKDATTIKDLVKEFIDRKGYTPDCFKRLDISNDLEREVIEFLESKHLLILSDSVYESICYNLLEKKDNYNGWSNYETWLLRLNLDNDYGLHQMMQEIVNDFIEDFELSETEYQEDKHYYICNLDDIIRDHLEELFWIEEHNIFKICDTWTYRDWQEINWYEIAESYLDDIN